MKTTRLPAVRVVAKEILHQPSDPTAVIVVPRLAGNFPSSWCLTEQYHWIDRILFIDGSEFGTRSHLGQCQRFVRPLARL